MCHAKSTDAINVEKSQSRLALAPTGTVLSCWTVMSKTMIGTGMLGLAAAFAQCGWFLGGLLLVGAALFAIFTLHLLNVLSSSIEGRHVSFYTVAENCAPWSRWIVDISITIKCIGVGTSYLQVAGDMGSAMVVLWFEPNLSKDTVRAIIVAAVVVLVAPLCFAKRLSKTAIVNVLGLVALGYVVILGVVYSDLDGAVTSVGIPAAASFTSILAKIPTFIFTFTCHQNMFLCAEDMKDRTQKKLDIVAVSSELTALCLFIPAVVFPYLTFGEGVSSNYMKNLDVNGQVAVQVGFLLLGIAEVCAFPLQLFPARKSLTVLLTRGGDVTEKTEMKLRVILTTIILLIAGGLAIAVKSLGVTFSFVGIIGSNTICFIMPTFLYCMTVRKNGDAKTAKVYLSAGLCVFALALVPVCLGSLIYQISIGNA